MKEKTTKINRKEKSSSEKLIKGFAWGFGIFGFIILILAIILFSNGEAINTSQKINANKFGNFGSFVSGAVGAIWSFVGVILFYLSLKLQREELEDTRAEMRAQKVQMEQQNKTLKQQRFEDTFFQLLKAQSEIVSSLELMPPDTPLRGRNCFGYLRSRLHTKMIESNSNNNKDILSGYSNFNNDYKKYLGQYFSTLYQIFKFVHESDVEDKKRYSNIVRAQLSNYELALLFYNCLSEYGKKFKPLVEEFSLLKHLDKSLVFNQEHIKEYDKKAYGNS